MRKTDDPTYLKARLQELEDTFRAIRAGAIDSLFITGDDGSGEIYSVSSADKPYRLMVEKMREGAALLDDELTVSFANRALATLLDAPANRILGHSFLDWVEPRDVEFVRSALDDEAATSVSCHLLNAAKIPIAVQVSLSSFDTGSGGLRRSLVISDIRNDEDLAKLTREDKHKDEFLAMLAHELRNPLAPISTAVAIVRETGELNASQAHAIDSIERQMSRLVHLVDDLLDVARIRNASMRIERKPVSLRWVLDAAVESVDDLFRRRGHRLERDHALGDVIVLGDRLRLVQVFSNLLTNACKYTPPGGSITLRTRFEGPYIRIDVEDDGTGIAPENIDDVFQLFAQADRTLDRAEGGLGLGLSIVRTLVDLHGGRVAAESAGLGRGSTFSVWLVANADAPEPPESRSGEFSVADDEDALRILIVDDNKDAADMLGMLLESRGYRVAVTYHGADALKLAGEECFNLVLLDIGLPDIDGHEVAQRLRAGGPTAHSFIVAVTGYGTEKDRKATSASGFDHHLVKPVSADELEEVIAAARTCR